jgi:hypothetical protein
VKQPSKALARLVGSSRVISLVHPLLRRTKCPGLLCTLSCSVTGGGYDLEQGGSLKEGGADS